MNLAVPKKAHEETFFTLVTRKNYDQWWEKEYLSIEQHISRY